MNTFKISNTFIAGLINWLNIQPMKGQYSRNKTRFIRVLQVRLKEYIGFQKELLGKYVKAETDKDKLKAGIKYQSDPETKEYIFNDDKAKASYITEMTELNEEEFIVKIDEANSKMFSIVKKVVLDTEYEFGPKDNDTPPQMITAIRLANEYEKWCDAFELLKIK